MGGLGGSLGALGRSWGPPGGIPGPSWGLRRGRGGLPGAGPSHESESAAGMPNPSAKGSQDAVLLFFASRGKRERGVRKVRPGVCWWPKNAVALASANYGGSPTARPSAPARRAKSHNRRCICCRSFRSKASWPNVITYSAAISACEKGQKPQQALHLPQEVQVRGRLSGRDHLQRRHQRM